MSAASEAIEKQKERERRALQNSENAILCSIAVLFRAAGIARQSDEENNNERSSEKWRNTYAINQAKQFIDACRAQKIWPEDPPKL